MALDRDEIKIQCKYLDLCPYHYSIYIYKKKDIDLIFAPYEYVLDNTICERMELNLNNSILIFDEAHNIETKA